MAVAIGKVIDEAWQRPSPASCKAAGINGVIGYVSEDTTGKNITHAEFNGYLAGSIAVGLVYEYGTAQSLNGFNQGWRDADLAQGQASSLGLPDSRPLFFAVDFQAQQSQLPVVASYFQGIASRISLARVGVYGDDLVVSYLLNTNNARWAWQTSAWSGQMIDPRIVLYQDRYDVNIGGALVDINEDYAYDWGGYLPGVFPPALHKDADMYLAQVTGQPAIYLVYPDGTAKKINDEAPTYLSLRAQFGGPVVMSQADFNWLVKVAPQS